MKNIRIIFLSSNKHFVLECVFNHFNFNSLFVLGNHIHHRLYQPSGKTSAYSNSHRGAHSHDNYTTGYVRSANNPGLFVTHTKVREATKSGPNIWYFWNHLLGLRIDLELKKLPKTCAQFRNINICASVSLLKVSSCLVWLLQRRTASSVCERQLW